MATGRKGPLEVHSQERPRCVSTAAAHRDCTHTNSSRPPIFAWGGAPVLPPSPPLRVGPPAGRLPAASARWFSGVLRGRFSPSLARLEPSLVNAPPIALAGQSVTGGVRRARLGTRAAVPLRILGRPFSPPAPRCSGGGSKRRSADGLRDPPALRTRHGPCEPRPRHGARPETESGSVLWPCGRRAGSCRFQEAPPGGVMPPGAGALGPAIHRVFPLAGSSAPDAEPAAPRESRFQGRALGFRNDRDPRRSGADNCPRLPAPPGAPWTPPPPATRRCPRPAPC